MKTVLAILLLLFFIIPGYSQVAVIANSKVKVDSITRSQLLDYYSGDIREWNNNLSIVVFDLPKGEIRNTFFEYIGKSSSRMKSIWLKKMLSGEGDPPKIVKNEKDMLETIAKTPGSIGFISSGLVNNTVKVLVLIE